VTDPPADVLARAFAEQLRRNPNAAELELTPPRDPNDNNPGSLVRSADELANVLIPFRLSHDRRQLVFARRDQGVSSIWIAAQDGTKPQRVFDVGSDQAKEPDGKLARLASDAVYDLQFSGDNRSVFFQADHWATSAALYRLDLATHKAVFVVDANGYNVITRCPKQSQLVGSIIAYRHTYDVLLATAFDVYTLVDPTGHKRGVIGPSPDNVDRYLHNSCAQTASDPPPHVAIPPRYLTQPACGDDVLRYAPLHLLDGSELPVFYFVKKSRAHESPTLDTIDKMGPIALEDLPGILKQECPAMP
jgi:hypothetical protein